LRSKRGDKMVNGNDLVEFEERNHEDLIEEFVKDNKEKYDEYIEIQFSDYCARLV